MRVFDSGNYCPSEYKRARFAMVLKMRKSARERA